MIGRGRSVPRTLTNRAAPLKLGGLVSNSCSVICMHYGFNWVVERTLRFGRVFVERYH